MTAELRTANEPGGARTPEKSTPRAHAPPVLAESPSSSSQPTSVAHLSVDGEELGLAAARFFSWGLPGPPFDGGGLRVRVSRGSHQKDGLEVARSATRALYLTCASRFRLSSLPNACRSTTARAPTTASSSSTSCSTRTAGFDSQAGGRVRFPGPPSLNFPPTVPIRTRPLHLDCPTAREYPVIFTTAQLSSLSQSLSRVQQVQPALSSFETSSTGKSGARRSSRQASRSSSLSCSQ